jgi:hypothetical protein|tara:strand:+ start:699 stop:947 length:249 start_codon:yes stop_codon:yes gene_type:complete
MTKLGFIVFTMGVMFFLSAMMIDTFDNLLLYFDHLIKALTDKEYFLSNIEGTFRVMLWFFMMWLGGVICLAGLTMMKLIPWK